MRLPRALHPAAWWLWALGLATAASRTTNPLLLVLIAAVLAHVVAARRTEAPWARGFKAYVYLGLAVIVIRVVFRMLLDGQHGAHVLFTLPEVPLPEAAAGIRIGGRGVARGAAGSAVRRVAPGGAAAVRGSRQRARQPEAAAQGHAGAPSTRSASPSPSPSRSPRSSSRAASACARARRLRGESGPRFHVFREIALPVMTDALDRSLLLAAAMDARGYGRQVAVPRPLRAVTEALLLGGLVAIGIGTYGVLDSTAPRGLGLPMLLAGAAAGWAGMALSGRRVSRSAYRPDPWLREEWCVAGIGVLVAAVVVAVSMVDPTALYPSIVTLQWPSLPLVPSAAILLGVLPAWIAPPTRLPAPPATDGRPTRGAGRVIRFEAVTITYTDAPAPVLRDVDLTIAEGELCVVVGRDRLGQVDVPRGHQRAGAPLHRRAPGRARHGRRPRHPHASARELADVVGMVGQDPLAGFVTDTVEEELAYAMEQLAVPADVMRKRVEETLDLLGIADLRRPRAAHRCRVVSSSAWRSDRCSPPTRASSCSTSRPRRSTPPPPRTCSPPSPGSSTTSASRS